MILAAAAQRKASSELDNALDPGARDQIAQSIGIIPPIPPSASAARAGRPQFSDEDLRGALEGMSIVIIHVKTALFPSFERAPSKGNAAGSATGDGADKSNERRRSSANSGGSTQPRKIDPRSMQQRILEELREMEKDLGLGIRIELAQQGQRIEV